MKTKIPGLLAFGILAHPLGASAAVLTSEYEVAPFPPDVQLPIAFDFGQVLTHVTSVALTLTPCAFEICADTIGTAEPVSVSLADVDLVFHWYYPDPGLGVPTTQGLPLTSALLADLADGSVTGVTSTTLTGAISVVYRLVVETGGNTVPEPGTLWLLGLGLAGLGLSRRRKAN